MKTIYCTTANITAEPEKVIDLEQYRQNLALEQEGSLAPLPRQQEDWDEVIQGPWAPLPPKKRTHHPAARNLDLWCSVSVLLMTTAFTLRVLLG